MGALTMADVVQGAVPYAAAEARSLRHLVHDDNSPAVKGRTMRFSAPMRRVGRQSCSACSDHRVASIGRLSASAIRCLIRAISMTLWPCERAGRLCRQGGSRHITNRLREIAPQVLSFEPTAYRHYLSLVHLLALLVFGNMLVVSLLRDELNINRPDEWWVISALVQILVGCVIALVLLNRSIVVDGKAAQVR